MTATDIFNLTDDELIKWADADFAATKGVLVDIVTLLQSEMQRIDLALSDFTQRSSILFAIAGLLTFLPALGNLSPDYLRHFLIWTFPWLLVSLFFFYLSSIRPSAMLSEFPVVQRNTAAEIILLKNQAKALEKVWRLMYLNFNKVRHFYTYCSATIYSYIFSFASNLAYFAFVGLPPYRFSANVVFLQIFLIYWLIESRKRQSRQLQYQVNLEELNRLKAAIK